MELEKQSKIKSKTLDSSFRRLVKRGLVVFDDNGQPCLTEKAFLRTKSFQPTKLKGSHLIIIFDIPEKERHLRSHLRLLLKELSFKMVQQSVWSCEYDYKEYLAAEIHDYALDRYVILYEAVRIDPRKSDGRQ